jgi:hypothetical protein
MFKSKIMSLSKTCSIVYRHLLPPNCGSGGGGENSCGIYEDETAGVFWVGSEDITVTKDIPSGTVTFNIPENGCLAHWGIYWRHGDFNYSAGLFSDGCSVIVDNSANGPELAFDARFYNITAAGAVSPANPLTLNAPASLDIQYHEYAGGVTRMALNDMRARATAGGYLFA